MILGFKHKRIEAFYNTDTTKAIRPPHAVLGALEEDVSPKDLKLCVLLIPSAKR